MHQGVLLGGPDREKATPEGFPRPLRKETRHSVGNLVILASSGMFRPRARGGGPSPPASRTYIYIYLPSYVTFCRFCRVRKVANPFLVIWDSFFMILYVGPRPPAPFNPLLDPAVYKSILPRVWRIRFAASLHLHL